jgi:hypothetical protein
MKLKFLLLLGLCLTGLALSTKSKSKQLFDVVSKEIDTSSKMRAHPQHPQTKSIFDIPNQSKPQKPSKNLFDALNFSQVKEKTLGKTASKNNEGMSLFSAFENKSASKVNSKSSVNMELYSANSNKVNSQVQSGVAVTNNKNLNLKSNLQSQNTSANQNKNSVSSKNKSKSQNKKTHAKNKNKLKHSSRKNKSNSKSITKNKKTHHKKSHSQKNKNSSQSTNKNSASTQKKTFIKIGGSLNSESKNESELKKLKRDVASLLEMNHKLLKKLKKTDEVNKKKRRFKKNVVSFIQKYDKDVSTLKKNIESSKDFVEHKIVQKNEEFQKLYESTEKNFEQLQVQVKDVQSKISQLETEETKKLAELHSNFSIKDLNINNKLDVEGISFMNKLSAKSLDVGNIKIDTQGVNFSNENVKLIVGKEMITVGQLLNNLASFRKLINICGENFEKCKPVTDEILRDQAAKQQAILDSLKKLRQETTQVLSRHRRRN